MLLLPPRCSRSVGGIFAVAHGALAVFLLHIPLANECSSGGAELAAVALLQDLNLDRQQLRKSHKKEAASPHLHVDSSSGKTFSGGFDPHHRIEGHYYNRAV